MTAYLDGQRVEANDLLLLKDLKILGGGAVKTANGNDLQLLPDTGGITKIGTGTPGNLSTPTNDDVYIAGRSETDGIAYTDGGIRSAAGITMTSANDAITAFTSLGSFMPWNAQQTVAAFFLLTGTTGNYLALCEYADKAVDFGIPQKTNPTWVIQSANSAVPAQRTLHYHDQTDGVAETETGDYLIKTPPQKTLKLGTVVWDDLRVPLTAKLQGASNPPTFAQYKNDGGTSVGVFNWHFGDQALAANEEQLWFSAQIPHDYKEGTDIVAHIHWTPKVSGGADEFVKWGLEYHWTDVGDNFPNTTIITSNAATGATATTSGDTTLTADEHYVTVIGTISGSGLGISSMLNCRIFRNSSDATDDLAQDAVGFEMDFHYQIDTMGSRQAFAK
jgi:hypothetical protein